MEVNRYRKQIRKASKILGGGLRPTAILGRFKGAKVLVNSVPKAGTNLLQELVQQLPMMRGLVTKTFTLKDGSDALCQKIIKIKKGQSVGSHISFDAKVAQTIKDEDIRHVLIIRDFRDVILSNVSYLDSIHISHPHNAVFAALKTMDEKISVCLEGVPSAQMMAWPELIHSYRKWVGSPNTLIVKYEDLVNPDSGISESVIKSIANHLDINPDSFSAGEVRRKMFNPKGLTYNNPGVDKWKKGFSESQIIRLNNALKDELEFFGYSTQVGETKKC